MKYISFKVHSKHLAVIRLEESITTGGTRKYAGNFFRVPLLHRYQKFDKLWTINDTKRHLNAIYWFYKLNSMSLFKILYFEFIYQWFDIKTYISIQPKIYYV